MNAFESTSAKKLNKAIGKAIADHDLINHADDAFETLFLNLFYSGRLAAMPPKYMAESGQEVIRPLIFCDEEKINPHLRSSLKSALQNVQDEFLWIKNKSKSLQQCTHRIKQS